MAASPLASWSLRRPRARWRVGRPRRPGAPWASWSPPPVASPRGALVAPAGREPARRVGRPRRPRACGARLPPARGGQLSGAARPVARGRNRARQRVGSLSVVVAIVIRYRDQSQRAKQPVSLVIHPSGEVQEVGCGSRRGAEGDGPQSGNLNGVTAGIMELSPELPTRGEHADAAITKIADQNLPARRPEVQRRPRDPPRGIERAARSKAGDPMSVRIEHVDEAAT